jgi:hypothetical protein
MKKQHEVEHDMKKEMMKHKKKKSSPVSMKHSKKDLMESAKHMKLHRG